MSATIPKGYCARCRIPLDDHLWGEVYGATVALCKDAKPGLIWREASG